MTSPDNDTTIVFGTGDRFEVGTGIAARVDGRSDDPGLGDRVRAAMGASGGSVAFGAAGFEPNAPARFIVPERVETLSRDELAARLADPVPAGDPRLRTRTAEPTEEEFAELVRRALKAIDEEEPLRKVVLGRWLDLRFEAGIEVRRILSALLRQPPHTHVFSLPHPPDARSSEREPTWTLVGGSPELLVERHGRSIGSWPLAGSLPRSADPTRLTESDKDRHEHGLVVDQVTASLTGVSRTPVRAPAPELFGTDSMWHLGTRITAELAAEHTDLGVVELAQLLHPTPAVAGTPTGRARELIAALEPDRRGPMTGWVVRVDAAGDGTAVLAIRSALVDSDRARLFAGAGIVPGSDPDAEVAETGAKFATMLSALGVGE